MDATSQLEVYNNLVEENGKLRDALDDMKAMVSHILNSQHGSRNRTGNRQERNVEDANYASSSPSGHVSRLHEKPNMGRFTHNPSKTCAQIPSTNEPTKCSSEQKWEIKHERDRLLSKKRDDDKLGGCKHDVSTSHISPESKNTSHESKREKDTNMASASRKEAGETWHKQFGTLKHTAGMHRNSMRNGEFRNTTRESIRESLKVAVITERREVSDMKVDYDITKRYINKLMRDITNAENMIEVAETLLGTRKFN